MACQIRRDLATIRPRWQIDKRLDLRPPTDRSHRAGPRSASDYVSDGITLSGKEDPGRTLAEPPLCAATWSPRRLARAAPNWMFCVRSLPQPNGPANALDLPVSARTRCGGPGCRSTGRSAVAAIRSATRTGLHVRPKRRCLASPAQVDAQTRVVRPPPRQVLL